MVVTNEMFRVSLLKLEQSFVQFLKEILKALTIARLIQPVGEYRSIIRKIY